jgi:ribonuclease PH
MSAPFPVPIRWPQRNDLRSTRFDVGSDGVRPELSHVHTGRTAVICSVCLEEGVPKWRKGSGARAGSVPTTDCCLGQHPQPPARELMKLSGRTQEIQRLIGRSLRACLDMEALGERPC